MIDSSLPYPSQRAPLAAANVVATWQPLAVQSGVDALRRGGNAVDAALAAAITLSIVEPCSNGIGSDAFAILWDGSELVGINGSGRAPALWTRERFSGHTRMPQYGWDSVTVPGAVSVWVALSARYGRLPFERLFDDAIRYAESGFQVGPRTALHWAEAADLYAEYRDFADHFLPAPAFAARVSLPDAARTLREIAESGGESFYRGALAERMEAAAVAQGGALRTSDLAAHRADWVTPLAQPYRDVTLHEIPPNGQGLAAQIALGILGHAEPPRRDSAEALHRQIEAMKIALRAAADHIADPAAMQVGVEALLDPASLARAATSIGERAASLPPRALPTSPDTVYLCAADADGMMVSFIQSNYYGFGSGIVVPGTGIALQNRGFGFSLEPGHPNEVGPRKRPFHTIIPGFVTEQDAPRLAFGVMGGPMQAQGHVQMMTRLFDYGQNPQAASDAPRWQVLSDYSVLLEPGVPDLVAADLAERGHDVRIAKNHLDFGGAQLVLRTADGYVAGSDHRKEGHAGGF
ncbi:MAG: gamma-glutamyltransferase family protein [Gammaproteobacteria bacterium]